MAKKETRISQRISLKLDNELKEAAKSMNLKRAVLVREALTQYLESLNNIENPAA
jgi:predicted DNA-binding protein